ncbi:MAG: SUMF1/EgtB/PvdO family nonheme iron enzyme, partial [Bacteroidota bacterium]
MDPTIFVSYRRNHREAISRLVDQLEKHRTRVWWDGDLRLAETWPDVVDEKIRKSDFFLLCISRGLEDSYVLRELQEAVEAHRTTDSTWLIPIIVEPSEIPRIDVGGRDLAEIHTLSLVDDFDAALDGILRLVHPSFSIRPQMVLVPPEGQHQIMPPFWIGKYPVTEGEWREVVGRPASGGDPNHPVVNVTWNQVHDFLEKLNASGSARYRLPTEAEWEFACRAGMEGDFGFDGGLSKLGDHAWYVENSDDRTHRVGLKAPNAWGIYDMHGNVCEWTQDIRPLIDEQGHRVAEAVT